MCFSLRLPLQIRRQRWRTFETQVNCPLLRSMCMFQINCLKSAAIGEKVLLYIISGVKNPFLWISPYEIHILLPQHSHFTVTWCDIKEVDGGTGFYWQEEKNKPNQDKSGVITWLLGLCGMVTWCFVGYEGWWELTSCLNTFVPHVQQEVASFEFHLIFFIYIPSFFVNDMIFESTTVTKIINI